jgi:hypothetical protein
MGDSADSPSSLISVEHCGRKVAPSLGQTTGAEIKDPKSGQQFYDVLDTHAHPVVKPGRHNYDCQAKRRIG